MINRFATARSVSNDGTVSEEPSHINVGHVEIINQKPGGQLKLKFTSGATMTVLSSIDDFLDGGEQA